MPVAADFAGIRDRVVASVDARFAEPVRLSFLVKGKVDPTRPAREIKAPLRVGGGDSSNMTGGFAAEWRTRLASGKAELHIDPRLYPDLAIRAGDRVRAMSRPGQPWWEVLRIDDRGESRLVLELGEV